MQLLISLQQNILHEGYPLHNLMKNLMASVMGKGEIIIPKHS